MSRRVSFVSEVDDNKADAGTGHGHKEKYQDLFQGAHTSGLRMIVLRIHFPHSGEDAPTTYYQLKQGVLVQDTSEL